MNQKTNDVFSWLRFPLAVAVVFIHCSWGRFCTDLPPIGTPEWGFEVLRSSFSKIIPQFAVPTFFLISGYFFFLNMPQWDKKKYVEKLRRRVGTLLIPYICWNILYALHISWPGIHPLLNGTRDLGDWWERLQNLGGWHIFWDCRKTGLNFPCPILVPLWFIRNLMILVLAAPLIQWLIKKLRWGGVVVVLGLWIVSGKWSILNNAIYFAIGASCCILSFDLCHYCRRYLLPIALVTIGVLGYLIYTAMNGIGIECINLPINHVYKIASILSVIGLATLLNEMGWVRRHKSLEKASMFIYMSHIFFIKNTMRGVKSLIPDTNFPLMALRYFLIPIIVVTLCTLLYLLWLKVKKINCEE